MMIIALKAESLRAAHEQGKLEISFGVITTRVCLQTI